MTKSANDDNASRARIVEKLASRVIAAHAEVNPPVDVRAIAAREKIILAEDDYGPDFEGRIEYHHQFDRFILYHPPYSGSRLNRVRFSIAHELGHFFIPEHNKALRAGNSHNSKGSFFCDQQLEREADHFAAALLIPERLLHDHLPQTQSISLEQLDRISERFAVSFPCAVIRYVKWSENPIVVIASANGKSRYCIASDSARVMGFHSKSLVSPLPQSSLTLRSIKGPVTPATTATSSRLWFPSCFHDVPCWEELIERDNAGLTFTLLTLDIPGS